MIIDKIRQGLKTSEQRVTTIINDTCLGFQRAEKAFIEKLLKNVDEEIDRFNSSNDIINVIGRSCITAEVRFKDWSEWEAYYKYIDTTTCEPLKRIQSFIRKSVIKYGFPENSIFSCYDNGPFRFILYSFGDTSLGERNSTYEYMTKN